MAQDQGQLKQEHFFDNTKGLNLSDSPFKVLDGQATSGVNYTYLQTGGIRKRKGHSGLNSVANSVLQTIGIGQYVTSANLKALLRATDSVLQTIDEDTGAGTPLSEDTLAAGTSFFSSGTTRPAVFQQFNTGTSSVLWVAGGGLTAPVGAYSTIKATRNGVEAPGGSISTSVAGSSGTWTTTGTYRYAVAFRKLSTQALSNAVFSVTAVVAVVSNVVTVSLTTLTGVDVTKHDKIYIYRSAVGGAEGFTTGDLVAQVNSNVTSYADTGTAITSATNIPRTGSLVLDNGVLPTGVAINCVTTFKRRLIVAIGNTIYLSDVNKSESWPAGNNITVPFGGQITGLTNISFTSATAQSVDELLVIFTLTGLWVVTGSSLSDWSLKFIDPTGAPNQSCIVTANGYLSWVDYRGIYLWDGTGKPIYASRLIEPLFGPEGDLDKNQLGRAVGQFYRKQNIITWALSHKTFGEQKLQLKLDLRLTLPNVEGALNGRIIDGVFIQDKTSFPVYGALAYTPTIPEEQLLMGDASGFMYKGFAAEADAGAGFEFTYGTSFLDQGDPFTDKRYHYVVVWVQDVGDWDLYLDWWTDFKSSEAQKSTRALPIAGQADNTTALWDVAFWDVAFWNDYTTKLRPVVFNLGSDPLNNSEGRCLRLQFRQNDANAPVTISGFSVVFSVKGARNY